jgi:hypothetical protein
MVDQTIDNTLPPAFFKHFYHRGLMFIRIIDGKYQESFLLGIRRF